MANWLQVFAHNFIIMYRSYLSVQSAKSPSLYMSGSCSRLLVPFSSCIRSLSDQAVTDKGILKHLDGGNATTSSKQDRFDKRSHILRKTLRRPAQKVLDGPSSGVSESTSQDLADYMNDYLEKNKIFKSKGRTWDVNTTDYLEIVECDLNQDYSHCHAQWSCPAFDHLLRQLLKVEKSQSSVANITQMSFAERYRMAKKVENKMNLILERLEGKFRSRIIREVNLRRVPRIFFAPSKRTSFMLEQLRRAAAV